MFKIYIIHTAFLFFNIIVGYGLRNFNINSRRLPIYKKIHCKSRLQLSTSTDQNATKALRVYKPKSTNVRVENDALLSFSSFASPVTRSNPILVLSFPHYIVRFRTPRIKSKLKLQLEELQDIYKAASDNNHDSRSSTRSFESTGTPSTSKFGDNHIFDSFSSSSKKGGVKFKNVPKEGDRKGGSGDMDSSHKSHSEKRFKTDNYDDSVDETSDDSSDAEDYYGDEEGLGMSLASVSADELRDMDMEGFTLEEIQMSLYGEYGIKVSVQAIRRRLSDDRNDRKSRSRTGKTRREKNKARQNRMNPVSNDVALPVQSTIQISVLSELIGVSGGEIIKYLMLNMGIMSSINQNIDISVAKTLVTAFGKNLVEEEPKQQEKEKKTPNASDLSIVKITHTDGEPRSPVVSIMGHVNHGKTSLLDSIRKTQVVLGEAGGITQAISAFKVKTSLDREITFIDTPGHAAFSEMRKRGANITDIVILVVAADDGIMEQTIECINAAKSAGCPVVVAVNKIDKEGANPQKILEDLMKYNIVVEDFGGDTQYAQIAAKKSIGIEDLLERVLLQAEIMNLSAKRTGNAEGTVIEASIDRRQGITVTGLVQNGVLKVGDCVVAGAAYGKVRKIISDSGRDLKEAGPSTPCQIIGLSTVPNAGDKFVVFDNEEEAKTIADARQRIMRQSAGSASSASIIAQATGLVDGNFDNREILKIPIVLKADVIGSIEAIASSINSLEVSDSETICKVDIVSSGVGDVTFSDISVATAAKAKVIAFNVGPGQNVQDVARASNVEISYHNVVYDLLEILETSIKTTFAPPPPGTLLGRAEILKSFKLGKVGNVAGCTVTEGLIKFDSKIRILRGKRNQIYIGKLDTLRVGKDTVSEVPNGSECGMHFEDFQEFETGDIIECFENKFE